MDLFGNVVPDVIEEEKEKKIGLFDHLTDITFKKENLPYDEKSVGIYMILSGLSQHADTIMYANEMNKYYDIPPQIQYDYLFNSIRSRKRYGKWAKKKKNDDALLVSEYFNISEEKTLSALAILSDAQIDLIRNKMKKGGKRNI